MKRLPLVRFGPKALLCAGLLLAWAGFTGAWAAGPTNPELDSSQALPAPCMSDKESAPDVERTTFCSSPIFDGKAKITERLWAAHHLGHDLSREQIARLYAFLKALPEPQEENLPALTLLKNDITTLLQEQTYPPAGLTSTLIEVYRNPAQDPVARDYALQHLVTWYGQGAADAPDAKARIQAVLRQAAQDDTSLAGTALLGLHRIIVSDSQTMRLRETDMLLDEELSRLALQMLLSTNLPCASRISAIQVCAEREIAEALPTVQALAQAEADTALRISAIAALGWLGGPEQAVLLQRLEAERKEALSPAIQGALRRLQTRLRINPAITQNSL